MKKNKQNEKTTPQQIAETIRNENTIITDILGSYTGTGRFDDTPEQDADDL